MQFNSWEFVVFFAAVYAAYLSLRTVRSQNIVLLAASLVFYARWDWRFLGLLLVSTLIDWVVGILLGSTTSPRRRKVLVALSMTSNLTILGFFKYWNFFVDSAATLVAGAGVDPAILRLDIVLPVGISFYTFQTMSYAVDVYRGHLQPTRNLLDFALFVSFFPQLVAGPIERAAHLLPQCSRPRVIDAWKVRTGLWLIGWGLWKKVVIADNMAFIADPIFDGSAGVGAATAYLGVVAFAFQIYGDFSAYSDIARGTARLMGFELMVNFDLPYFARNPSDFWRRWHISLSSWLRDYLYIPLGGNRRSPGRTYANLATTMLLGGLWHGAAWNFVAWGAWHGLILILQRLMGGARAAVRPLRAGLGALPSVVAMFHLTLVGWLLFRCTRRTVLPSGRESDESFAQIAEMVLSFRNGCGIDAEFVALAARVAALAVPLLLVQWFQFTRNDHLVMLKLRRPLRILVMALLLMSFVLYGVQSGVAFIYFQF